MKRLWPFVTRRFHDEEVGHLRGLVHKALDPGLLGIECHHNMMEIGLKGGMAQVVAAGFIEQFKDVGAKNYIQIGFTSDAYGPFTVTIQRVYGKSPTQVLNEAEEVLREAQGLLEGEYGHGVDNGNWPTIAPVIRRMRDYFADRPHPPPEVPSGNSEPT